MNISIDVTDLIVDGEIRQWEWQKEKGYATSELCICASDGNYIFIKFESPEKLTDFCNKHNFPLKDNRNEQ